MNERFRILHLDTERTWRGGEQQVFFLASFLARRGHCNTIVCPPGSPLLQRCQEENLRAIPLKVRGEWDLSAVLALRRILAARTIQIVHAHNAHGVALGALSHCSGLQGLVVSRRVDFPIGRNPFSRWKYRQADRIIAISGGVKKILLADGLPEKNIRVVHSGLDLSRFNEVSPHNIHQEWGLDPAAKTVGMVAALAPHKDHRTFLEAARMVMEKEDTVRFFVVGEGALRPLLESLARSLRLRDRVIFTGFREEALSILASLDVVVLSSATEGMGTVLLEAMALRRPVVATQTGGIPEVVVDGETGFLVPPKQPAAMAERILNLLQDSNLAKKFGERGFQKVREFSMEDTGRRTEQVYRELLKSEPVCHATKA